MIKIEEITIYFVGRIDGEIIYTDKYGKLKW